MSDYERQFLADLEKAQALSLESLALEQFKQQRRLLADHSLSENEGDTPIRPTRSRSNSSGFPQPLPPPPRKPARRTLTSFHPEGVRSTSNSPTPCDAKVADLISFNAPTSVEKSRMELKEQINQIHKLTHQADQSSLVPIQQSLPKLSHSNSSISTHSAQNIIPYHSNNSNLNYINPIIGFPSNFSFNQYQNPTPVLNVANSNQNYNTKISNIYNFDNAFSNKHNIGTTVNTLYPNLGNFQLNETNQHGYQFNNCKNVPASVPVDFAAPNQINTFPDTNNTFPASTGIVEESSNKPNMVLNFTPPLVDNFTSNIIKSKSVEVNLMDTNYTSQTWNVLHNPSNEIAKTTTLDMKKSSSDINTSMSTKPLFWTSTTQPEKSINLIDLAANASNSNVKSQEASVLEAFDPLIADQSNTDYMFSSECSSSIYDEFDPLDYIYVEKRVKESPVYAVVNRDEKLSPVPSPAPKSLPPSTTTVIKRDNALNKKLFETVVPIKARKYDPELVAFLDMLIDVRAQYRYSDLTTNPGYVVALKSEGTYPNGTSIKLLVHFEDYSPITFTCDVESTVEHVIMHVVCELEGEIKKDISGYKLRVWGLSEYLTSGSSLREYAYVRQCVRLEKDVVLCLHSSSETRLSRTERDDIRDLHITLDRILPNQSLTPPISYHNLSILLETLERELSRVTTSVSDGTNVRIGSTAQAVKAICALLGGVQTVHVTNALETLIHACNHSTPDSNYMKPEILSDAGDYSNVSLRQATLKDTVGLHCQRLRDAIRGFISLYCRVNRVDFELDENQYASPNDNEARKSSSLINETALFYIEAIHRLPVHWNHDDFVVQAQVYYGTRTLKGAQTTNPCYINTQGFYPKIMLETWLNLDDTHISNLPKESRLVLTLIGRTLAHPENPPSVTEKDKATEAQESSEKSDKDISGNPDLIHVQQEELGWAAIQLFDFEGTLASGSFILPIWPMCADKRLGPAPDVTACPPQPHQLIHIEIPSYASGGVYWKDHQVDKNVTNANRHSFESLDKHTQQQLLHLVEQGPHQKMPSDCREVLWEKRHYLIEIPGALPLVLLASVNWDSVSKSQLLELLDHWKSPSPYDALHLLLPCFPDEGVRAKAVSWLSEASGNTLITLMPQLCLALRYERHVGSQLARLLLSRALESPRFAHRLYWQLVHDIPGNSPQNSSEESLGITLDNDFHLMNEPDEGIVSTYRWVRRNQILLRALLEVVGANLAERLLKQQLLVKGITDVAHTVKKCKENVRNRNLTAGVNNLIPLVTSENVCLPLSISQEIYDIDTKTCSYFQSNTLPLKISFISSDKTIVPAIFKIGDDLRQDSLVLQVITIMDQLWLKEGLDLSMVTFEAVPTHHKKGIIEMVCNAETLRSIQTEFGLTGSFKDKPIAEWLEKHNPSELEYERAVTNFTASCAGYSVATYLLGICDRHNDNIMLKTSGHLFHIDFGKFLGDAQMFGNFKRDRTPFVLTPDMAYVINGSDRPSRKFHHFVDLCCTAFNIVRKHHNLILNLFSLMASSGISGVSASSVGYVRAALLPGQTPAEAAATFARLIHSALKSKFTPINFFLHNLAQLRAGDQSASSSEILSFMPKTYTMEQDGRIINVEVTGCEKRYDPEKYYVYGLKTYREGQVTPFSIYRSYKHFCELYQKICLEHPLAKVHRVPIGLYMGRNNRQAAERRLADINAFVISLFKLADEIAHSKLVYTFFHPLLRDQQDISLQRVKPKTDNRQSMQNLENSIGKLNICIQYSAGVLSVLIKHAESLPVTSAGPPSTYVKVYLKPDPSKETKRKTRVLRKNCHPSFMEMLEYRLPLEVIRGRVLEASVWHYDPLQENQELGGVIIPLYSMDLTVETTQWHPLQYIPR